MADTVIEISDVIAEYGAYYLGQTRGQSNLFTELYRGIKELEMNILRTVNINATQWRSSDSILQSILQPYQKDSSANSQLDFIPNTIDLKKAKIELNMCPDDFSYSYLAFLEGVDNDRKTWPFVRWFIEQHIIPKLQEDISLEGIYKGVYTPPAVPGTAGLPSESMDGLEKVMDDFALAGKATPISIGAPPSGAVAFVEYVEDYLKSIPAKYRRRVRTVQMSEDFAELYHTGYQEKYRTAVADAQQNLINKISGFPARVMGMPSMEGKTRLWSTLPNNAVFVAKKWNNRNQIRVANGLNSHDEVDFISHLYMQASFALPRLAFFTDQV